MPCMFIPKYHVTSSVNIFKIPLSQDFIWPCSFNPISFYLKIPKFSKYLSLRIWFGLSQNSQNTSLRIWFGHARLIQSLFISNCQNFQNTSLSRFDLARLVSSYLFLLQDVKIFKIPLSQDLIRPCLFNPI